MRGRGGIATWVIWGICLLVVAAVAEVIWKTQANRPPEVPLAQRIPQDQKDPGSAAVQLQGPDLDAYLKREPLRVGADAPRMKGIDFRDEPFSVPPHAGKPTVFVVSCGCLECAQQLFRLGDFRKKMGDGMDSVGIIATTSESVWGHHAASFGMHRQIRVVHDEGGKYLRLIRPPGNKPTRLPIIWACDGEGKVRFVAQPEMKTDWTGSVTKALHLVPKPRLIP